MLTSYASSSAGNLYTVSDGETKIILEAGVPFRRLSALLGHHVLDHAACFITHQHDDHAQAAAELARRGMPLYCHEDTARALGLEAEADFMLPGVCQRIGSLVVMAIEAKHDVACLGYIIQSVRTGERLLFALDTCYLPNRFAGLTEIAVECNYSRELMRQDDAPASLKKRIMRSHMAVETFLDFTKANDMSRVRKIWLLHMSSDRGNAELFRRMVQEATGIPTEVCK